MDVTEYEEWLTSLRRELHQRPEPAWREFYTTARIVEELESLGVDDILIGREILADGERSELPEEGELERWFEQARETDADDAILDQLEGGYTGAIATIERGDGPTLALRVDIDGLPRLESESPAHYPAAEGFRSIHEGAMHACGHDAHATIGLGVVRAVLESDFAGTLKVIFQPAEEVIGGAKPIAESGHLDDVDALMALHIGLDHPTGEVVAGVDGFLAVSHIDVAFAGEPAHAGAEPNVGRNANVALATAVQNMYAIPRHKDGETRINAGVIKGGSASNIIAEEASIHGEVRGETTALMEYMKERATEVVEGAAAMHGCDATVEFGAEAPSAESDELLVELVAGLAAESKHVENVLYRDDLGGSEDATYLMQRVQDNGGVASYVGIGTDHPGGHHTATFDVEEESLVIGVDVLANALLELAGENSPLVTAEAGQ